MAPAPIARAESTPDEPSMEEPGKTAWETCYSSFAPSGDAEGDLTRLVRDCGTTGGMRAITKVKLGTQSSQDPVDRYAFQVPGPDKCYRIYAVGDSAVKDLDLLLRGPSGTSMVADITHDSWPVLPPREPVCISEPGLYMLEVSVYKGAGKYALQVWGR
ncbi:MAG TPA: hypothetical protein VH062_10030 [Polyangiaceae bacterium]|nr:hypothetical protein [Polyangiaceae bacterium]